MVQKNMPVGDSIRRNNRELVVIKSTVWNTVVHSYKEQYGKDISEYLGSIQIRGNTILIKTNKPLINSEILRIQEPIKKACIDRLGKIGIKWYMMELKCV
ncbi:MAG: hypothetical protein H6767_08880 [Candidatus Peribacteria bacterium]|nr:MAG: hypothetical protein H6767_08880 [Candidatus Peribacteria bacterium]